jgi:hypothetical protein
MFQVFHLDVNIHVASVCFKCFICMLQVFHLDVAYVLQWLHTRFHVFQTYVASVLAVFEIYCKCFIYECCKSRSGVAHVAM